MCIPAKSKVCLCAILLYERGWLESVLCYSFASEMLIRVVLPSLGKNLMNATPLQASHSLRSIRGDLFLRSISKNRSAALSFVMLIICLSCIPFVCAVGKAASALL